jgi:hypothetical protein
MVDLSNVGIQVVRATVAPEAIKSRSLDLLLARHGIPFELDQAVIPMPEQAERMTAAMIERGFDMIYVEAGRAQLKGFLQELSERSKEFPIAAVYFARGEAFQELLIMQVTDPPAKSDDPMDVAVNPLGPIPRINSTGEAQAVLAWRPHVANWEKLDKLFPMPKDGAAPKEFSEREWEAAVRAAPDAAAHLIFILRIEPADKP